MPTWQCLLFIVCSTNLNLWAMGICHWSLALQSRFWLLSMPSCFFWCQMLLQLKPFFFLMKSSCQFLRLKHTFVSCKLWWNTCLYHLQKQIRFTLKSSSTWRCFFILVYCSWDTARNTNKKNSFHLFTMCFVVPDLWCVLSVWSVYISLNWHKVLLELIQ